MAKPKSRAHGEGTIYQRPDGKFAAQVYLGKKANGKADKPTVYGKTRKEVADKLAKLKKDRAGGFGQTAGKTTVAEYLERWLKDGAALTVRPQTLVSYRRQVEIYALPHLGHARLTKLTPKDLQHWITEQLKAGHSKRTVEYTCAILRRAFKQAVQWGDLARSPMEGVIIPQADRFKPDVPAGDDLGPLVQKVVDMLVQDELGPLYYLALATGCRRGELVALRWQDVDLARGTVSINQTAGELEKHAVVFTDPKSDQSRRLIPLPGEAVDMLRRLKARSAEYRLGMNEYQRAVYQDHDLVFCRPDGSPHPPQFVTQHWSHLRAKYGLPPRFRVHDLRHTHATLLLAAGINLKITQERLGHSTIKLTGDTYSHVNPTMQQPAVRALDAMLPAAPDQPQKPRRRKLQ